MKPIELSSPQNLQNDKSPLLSTQQPKQIRTRCSQNNQAFQYCINEQCPKTFIFNSPNNPISIFTCATKSCKCRQDHKLCAKGDIDFTLEKINQKMKDTDKIKEYIEQTIQGMIDRLSQLREKLLQHVDKQYKYSYLTSVQKEFLFFVQHDKTTDFSLKKSTQLWKAICSHSFLHTDLLSQTQAKLSGIEGGLSQNIKQLYDKFKIPRIKQFHQHQIQEQRQQYYRNVEQQEFSLNDPKEIQTIEQKDGGTQQSPSIQLENPLMSDPTKTTQYLHNKNKNKNKRMKKQKHLIS